ncbi:MULTISPECIES: Clp protease N-terminal domain-containing protein [Nonomuraea]|uniref:Clp protease N-terminal domain-containing protein n=1 Tax=Nonomuraea harbinensis TaxID=1286938 RepID=A0ABW1C6S8_9ACTN|nr:MULTISPECIES: Clp protease N-terminal domain-containing protein [Nonomuraea]TXK40460.1 Clp protease [Nonomuraea sp. C10]
MFERFTDRARQVVVLAQVEARAMRHNYIGTEHLLLGLMREGEGASARVLADCGASLEPVREFVVREIGTGESGPDEHIPFTPRAKKVLELSLREALQLRHTYISSEHILLGLLKEGQGLGAQALAATGADFVAIRQRVLDRLDRGPKERPGETYFTASSTVAQRLAQIQESLERIERHLGIGPEPGPSD